MKKLKILMIFTSKFQYSGITSVVMNYYRELVKFKDLKIDFLVPNIIPDELKNELEKNGSKIHLIPMEVRRRKIFKYIYELKTILKKDNYDIVHVHGSSSIIGIELYIAKCMGVRCRIAHSHSVKTEHPILNFIVKPIFKRSYNVALACSDTAGKWLFKKRNFIVLPNGFEIEKFVYNLENRDKYRNLCKIKKEEFLIGHVGLFNDTKNQIYLVEILNKLLIYDKTYKLVLIGKGKNKEKIKRAVKKLKLDRNVIFYGETTNPEFLYSAMDMFMFPSKYEGLGLVAIEAQISNLPVIISNKVPNDVIINDNVMSLPINSNSIDDWVEIVIKSRKKVNNRLKDNISKFSKFDIKNSAYELYRIYKRSRENEK